METPVDKQVKQKRRYIKKIKPKPTAKQARVMGKEAAKVVGTRETAAESPQRERDYILEGLSRSFLYC